MKTLEIAHFDTKSTVESTHRHGRLSFYFYLCVFMYLFLPQQTPEIVVRKTV